MTTLIVYTHEAGSPSDKRPWMQFATEQAAQDYADTMNRALQNFDTNPFWKKDIWETRPEPWIVRKLEE